MKGLVWGKYFKHQQRQRSSFNSEAKTVSRTGSAAAPLCSACGSNRVSPRAAAPRRAFRMQPPCPGEATAGRTASLPLLEYQAVVPGWQQRSAVGIY